LVFSALVSSRVATSLKRTGAPVLVADDDVGVLGALIS
jgi:hypothetical protein